MTVTTTMTVTMTTTVTILAFLVAGAAAVRSTWSPCGLSMLSTITPFGEHAKGHRYWATASWFILGATIGGLALGGVMALLAAMVAVIDPTPMTVGAIGLVSACVVLVSDAGLAGVRLPIHCRQVNERWLDAYRPWVYGAGFGFQIGTGVATYITTAAIYLTIAFGTLTGQPVTALVIGGVFGLARGLAVTLTRRVSTPSALLAFHQRFAALRPRADGGVYAVLVVAVLVLAVAIGFVASLVVLVAVAVGTVGIRGTRRSQRTRGHSEGHTGAVEPRDGAGADTPQPSAVVA